MGKKSRHKREDRLIVGDAFLEESGVDVDAPDDELLPRLLELIGGNPEGDLAIADLLGSVPCQEAASRLTEWDAQKPRDKDLRRIIRASIFRLEQRGIAGAARARADEEPVRMAVRPEPTGWL